MDNYNSMNTFKKTFAVVGFMSIFVLSGYAQNRTDFTTFLELFPQRNFPLSLSYDDDSVWDINTPSIPDSLYEKYIFQKEHFVIKEKEEICFDGFLADGIFSTKKTYNLLLIGKDSFVSGCGEESWLVTYTPQGEIIDVLFVYGRSTNYDSNEERIPFRVESIITADSIMVNTRETLESFVLTNDNRRRSLFRIYERIYSISSDGKFIKDEENIKEEERYRE